jgi:nucleoside-triphosphatase THEP1
MLLIGIIGSVGSGKTSLLGTLAEWWSDGTRTVDGFLAIAGDRTSAAAGADRYDILMLRSSESFPYAVRDASLNPPYVFNEETVRKLDTWAESLGGEHFPSLVILDEFGPVEAAGGGHIRLWQRVQSSRPEIVVLAVRKGLEKSVETQMGCAFDLLVDVGSPEAWHTLHQACSAHSDWVRIGLYGGGAGGLEASVGAILHGSQVPLRGLFMSSMQSVIMTYAADGLAQRRRVVWVSFVSASIKALSPAGSRLRPMMAITLQGILYTAAIMMLGWNITGVLLGGFLVGAWSALQGVALQYLFVGNELLRAYDAIIQWVATQLHLQAIGFLTLVLAWTILCGMVSGFMTLLAWNRRRRMPERLRGLMFRKPTGVRLDHRPATASGAIRRGVKDVLRPIFWLPVGIVVAVMMLAGSPVESVLWVVIRAAGVGFVLFSLVRAIDVTRAINWLHSRGYWGPALAYRKALDQIGASDRSSSDVKKVEDA